MCSRLEFVRPNDIVNIFVVRVEFHCHRLECERSSEVLDTLPLIDSSNATFEGGGTLPIQTSMVDQRKVMCLRVHMLDETVTVFRISVRNVLKLAEMHVVLAAFISFLFLFLIVVVFLFMNIVVICVLFVLQHRSLGSVLYEEVFRHLNVLEYDYFGLEYVDSDGCRCWLEKQKPILKQISSAKSDQCFDLIVKFYTANPVDLEEEYTRYLFALQIKRDLASGELVCNENTAAVMASYIVQSECGDFCAEDYPDHTYLSSVRFVPNQSAEFERKVMENHKKLVGMMPTESDIALLETARRCEFYGIKLHPAKDAEGTVIGLTVMHNGIKVYLQLCCMSTFSWAKIRKLCFKRKHFYIKLHPDSYAYYKDTVEFSFETRHECKMFWKKCVEHHSFFRCTEANQMSRSRTKLFTKGSSFRYEGRTQKQLIEYLREHYKKREPFTRPIVGSGNRICPKRITVPLLPYDSLLSDNAESSLSFPTNDSFSSSANQQSQLLEEGSSGGNFAYSSLSSNRIGVARSNGGSSLSRKRANTLPKHGKRDTAEPSFQERMVNQSNASSTCSESFYKIDYDAVVYDNLLDHNSLTDVSKRLQKTDGSDSAPEQQENVSQGSYYLSESDLNANEKLPSTDVEHDVSLEENSPANVASTVQSENRRQRPTAPPKPKSLSKICCSPPDMSALKLTTDPGSDQRYSVIKHKVFDGDIPYTLHVRQLKEETNPGPVPTRVKSVHFGDDVLLLSDDKSDVSYNSNRRSPTFQTFCTPDKHFNSQQQDRQRLLKTTDPHHHRQQQQQQQQQKRQYVGGRESSVESASSSESAQIPRPKTLDISSSSSSANQQQSKTTILSGNNPQHASSSHRPTSQQLRAKAHIKTLATEV
ncbi:FERM domain-containing protein 7 [Trichinella pseudospiralis]|uniref:FERM domain-containing protein 7 n=1 Tax=Trichinella pseudospiralis TaxID=6337 RepID=A0A0V1IWX7_TRIPS|nr:FERM domain-containing protein 7 [Trichinella pseudospiralis]KRZ39856.1 FERM domain-containing protein 7 [Trichinella pseudospiralis]